MGMRLCTALGSLACSDAAFVLSLTDLFFFFFLLQLFKLSLFASHLAEKCED